ncbi:MAG TPA: EpsG family protein [Methylocella sp.]|jgi:hypothetical protein
MWPYWLMFLLPAAAALQTSHLGGAAAVRSRLATVNFTSLVVWFLLALLLGYRFEVGGDWFNYFRYLDDVSGLAFADVIIKPDPAYQVLSWISVEMDWGIFGVNLIGGAIFAFGLVAFCWAQPRPWLALAIAIPYLVIVVGMGYTRQAIALGLEMLGLLSLRNKSTSNFVIWMILAALFHKTAVMLIPIAALAGSKNRYWTAAWVAVTVVILYYFLLAKEMDALVTNYVGGAMQSDGALVRLLMNAVPASILLIWSSRFSLAQSEASLWRWIAIISLLLLILFVIMPTASTALDRMALYMLPLQLVVFSRLPLAFGATGNVNRHANKSSLPNSSISRLNAGKATPKLTFAVLLYYGCVQFIWLNFATNAFAWQEYRFYPWELLS